MAIVIREIHAASSAATLNEEWFVVENKGDKPFSTSGCTVAVGKGPKTARLRQIGALDPGFTLAPGDKVRVITGNPGKKSQGKPPPEDGTRNYHLFHGDLILAGQGTVVALSLKQHEVARATFDPAGELGIKAEDEPEVKPSAS